LTGNRSKAAAEVRKQHPGINLYTDAQYATRKANQTYAAALAYVTSAQQLLHMELNKDNGVLKDAIQGAIIEPQTGKTLSLLAQQIAEKETARQWNQLEAEIQRRYGEKADKFIERFKGLGEPARSVLFLVDTSGSMGGSKIVQARKSVADMVRKSLAGKTTEEWAILSFSNHNVYEIQPFTQDLQDIEKAVPALRAGGDTPLRYAEAKAMAYLLKNGSAPEGKLIVLCDGSDNCIGPAHTGGGERTSSGDAKGKLITLLKKVKLPARPTPPGSP